MWRSIGLDGPDWLRGSQAFPFGIYKRPQYDQCSYIAFNSVFLLLLIQMKLRHIPCQLPKHYPRDSRSILHVQRAETCCPPLCKPIYQTQLSVCCLPSLGVADSFELQRVDLELFNKHYYPLPDKASISSSSWTVSKGLAIQAVVHARRAYGPSLAFSQCTSDAAFLEVVRASRQELVSNMQSLVLLNAAKVILACQHAPALVADINEDVIPT